VLLQRLRIGGNVGFVFFEIGNVDSHDPIAFGHVVLLGVDGAP
jgi:hypothetical protein